MNSTASHNVAEHDLIESSTEDRDVQQTVHANGYQVGEPNREARSTQATTAIDEQQQAPSDDFA